MQRPIQPGETTPEISRRAFMAKAGAGAVVVGTVVPAAADPEHPWEKARRLARDLSEALRDGDGAWSGPGEKWFAEVHPASDSGCNVLFGNIHARDWPRQNISASCREVMEAHRRARAAFEKTCRDTDCVALGREPTQAALRRNMRAGRAEEAALTAVCAFHPQGLADAKAKANYLTQYIRWGELTHDQLLALVYSGVRI